jgi:hypothetical protein
MMIGITPMNKSDKVTTKVVKEIPANPLPDKTKAAEYIRKRRTQ